MKICRILATAVLMVGLCMPASAQDFEVLTFGAADERVAGMEVMVFDPEQGDYVTITLATLLDGIVDFPDELSRCVALRAYDANDPDRPDDFAASDFSGTHGLCRDGNSVGMPFPSVIPAGSLWISVAVPGTVGLPYISDGVVNFNENGAHFLTQQAGTITLDTGQTGYQVWTWTLPQFAGTASAVNYIFFLPRAVNP